MKILFFISGLSAGGAERALVNLSNAFLNRDYNVVIATYSDEEPFYSIPVDIKLIKMSLIKISNNRLESISNNIKRVYKSYQLIKRENPDIVISLMTQTNIISILASKLANKPIVIAEHIEYKFIYNSKLLYLLREKVYRFADALTVLSKDDYNYYKKYIDRVFIVPNIIKDDFCSDEESVKRENIVLAVGRLEEQKGFDTLISIFNEIENSYRLIIVGEGSMRESLNRIINNKNIEILSNQKDIEKWYKKSKIYAMTSRKEGLPTTLIEAMICGCVPISFDCPTGPSSLIDDDINGFLIDNQNIKEFKDKLLLLMEREELIEKFSKEARKIRDRFSEDRIMQEWDKIFKKVLNND